MNGCSYLLKFLPLDCRNSRPEARHALSDIMPGDFIDLRGIALIVLKMGEMEPFNPIRMQLQKTRGDNAIIKINCLASNVPFSFQDHARLVGYHKVVFDELAVEDVAGISKEREPA